MSCNFPNKMFLIGKKDNGKNDLLFCNGRVHHVELVNGTWKRAYSSGVSKQAERVIYQNIDVPCNVCLECRLDHSREWANRCLMEMAYHQVSMFITLTYDDEHVPHQYSFDDVKSGIAECETECSDTTKLLSLKTIRKKDLQDFIKRLRNYYGNTQKIRYFACAEYGEHTFRPHYHAIIFGAIMPDLVLHSESVTGKVFTSEILRNIWQKGNVLIAEANFNTAAYVARYVTKKAGNTNSDYIEKYGLEKEFITMSRRPGIGSYFYDNNDVFRYDHIVVGTDKGSYKFKQPRYFQKLLERDDPERYKDFKEKNDIFAKLSYENFKWTKGTDLEYLDYLETRDENLKKRVKSLERSKV